jgi:hypothetical protein
LLKRRLWEIPSRNPKPPAEIKNAIVKLSFMNSLFDLYSNFEIYFIPNKNIIIYPASFTISSTIGAIITPNFGIEISLITKE